MDTFMFGEIIFFLHFDYNTALEVSQDDLYYSLHHHSPYRYNIMTTFNRILFPIRYMVLNNYILHMLNHMFCNVPSQEQQLQVRLHDVLLLF